MMKARIDENNSRFPGIPRGVLSTGRIQKPAMLKRMAFFVLVFLAAASGILGMPRAYSGSMGVAIALAKTANQTSYIAVGDVLTYSFTVSNPGDVELNSVTVTDPLATVEGGTIASLMPGASDSTTFTARHTVTQPDLDAGSFTNTATASGTSARYGEADASGTSVVQALQQPSLSFLKTAVQARYSAVGDTLTYQFTVTNTGNVTLGNVTVTDSQATMLGAPITTLAPGASDSTTFTASYSVVQDDITAGSFTNTATVTASPPSGSPLVERATSTVSALQQPGVTLTKTADQTGYGNVGEVLTYTFTVTNTGNLILTDLSIADPDAAVSGGSLATLAPGESDSTTFTAFHTVTQADLDAGSLTNTATLSATPLPGTAISAVGSATAQAVVRPLITLHKAAVQSSYAAAGDVINYTFTVANTGNVTLGNVTVTDPGATVSGSPITLAPGESDSTTFTAAYTVVQADLDAGSFSNTATVTGTPLFGPTATATDSVTVQAVQSPSLGLSKVLSSAPTPIVAGSTLAYVITATNTGNVTLTNVVISDAMLTPPINGCSSVLPGHTCTLWGTYAVKQSDMDAGQIANMAQAGSKQTSPVSASLTTPLAQHPSIALVKTAQQTGYDAAGQTLAYSFTVTNTGNVTLTNVSVADPSAMVAGSPITLAPGASNSAAFTASHTVTQADINAGSFANTATATGTPPGGAAVTAGARATVSAAQHPSIALVKTAVQSSYDTAGGTLAYTFTVTNTGNVTLANVVVADPSATVSGGPITLEPGVSDSTTFTAIHTVTQADLNAGSFTNTAGVSGTPPSGAAVSAPGSAVVSAVQRPSIALVKTAVQTEYDEAGDTLAYTFTVSNTGNVTLSNVTVTDPSAAVHGAPVTLAPGVSDSTTFTATHAVTQAEVDAGQFVNTASATGTPPSGQAVGATAGATAAAVRRASIALVKTAVQSAYDTAGDALAYTFTVTNTGNVTLDNVIVTDPSATVTGGPITLAPGVSNSTAFTASHAVAQGDVNAGSFTNTAAVTGTPPSGGVVRATADSTVSAAQHPSIALAKVPLQSEYSGAGNVLAYGFTVTNTGNVTLTNVTVGDPLAVVSGGPITLEPGVSDSTAFTAVHTVTQADVDAGQVVNTATVTGTTPSAQQVANSASATVSAVQRASVAIVKTALQGSYSAAGDVLAYAFTVTNTGNVTLGNVIVSDPAAVLTGTPVTLAPGASDSEAFTAVHTVTQADLDAGQVVNTATVTGTPPSGSSVTASGAATVPAVQSPALTLEKNGAPNTYRAVGDVIAYTFTVTNTGNVTLYNVTISDGKAPVTGGPIVSLAPGASDSTTFTASYAVTQADLDSASVVNVATVSAGNLQGAAVTATAQATVIHAAAEGEGEITAEGEGEGEGEVTAEGEGEITAEGEGEAGPGDGCSCSGIDWFDPGSIIVVILSLLALIAGLAEG